MKVVYTNPVLKLTSEEEDILSRAIELLYSICEQTDGYDNCEHNCPIYKHCPYYHDFSQLGYTQQDILNNIVSEAEKEEE